MISHMMLCTSSTQQEVGVPAKTKAGDSVQSKQRATPPPVNASLFQSNQDKAVTAEKGAKKSSGGEKGWGDWSSDVTMETAPQVAPPILSTICLKYLFHFQVTTRLTAATSKDRLTAATSKDRLTAATSDTLKLQPKGLCKPQGGGVGEEVKFPCRRLFRQLDNHYLKW